MYQVRTWYVVHIGTEYERNIRLIERIFLWGEMVDWGGIVA